MRFRWALGVAASVSAALAPGCSGDGDDVDTTTDLVTPGLVVLTTDEDS